MGVPGLLPLLLPIAQPCHVSSFKTLGVDASIWLYRGAYSKVHPVNFFNKALDCLILNKIKPIVVFDGPAPDYKKKVTEARKKRRECAFAEYKEYLDRGDVDTANKKLKGCITVSKEMVEMAIELCNQKKITFARAVNEADECLAYLFMTKQIDGGTFFYYINIYIYIYIIVITKTVIFSQEKSRCSGNSVCPVR